MNNVFSSRLLPLLPVLCTMILAFGVFSGTSAAYAATHSGQAMHLASDYPTFKWSLFDKKIVEAADGTITFYNRSVGISGEFACYNQNSCPPAKFDAYVDTSTTPTDSASKGMYSASGSPYPIAYFPLEANVRGGASTVVITVGALTQTCTRSGCGTPMWERSWTALSVNPRAPYQMHGALILGLLLITSTAMAPILLSLKNVEYLVE